MKELTLGIVLAFCAGTVVFWIVIGERMDRSSDHLHALETRVAGLGATPTPTLLELVATEVADGP